MSDPKAAEASHQTPVSPLAAVLNRPPAERLREYKYRFAQSMVFGLPVLALHFFGPALGGPEAGRWTGMLQLLLAGWVMYVGATGMLVEAILRRKITADGIVAALSILIYLASGVEMLGDFFPRIASAISPHFWWSVIAIAGWSSLRWGIAAKRPEEM